jgi:hypothetical protein
MDWLGFEAMIPGFKRAKSFHAIDRAAAVTDHKLITKIKWSENIIKI